jgi:hypothetical protein
MKTYDKLASLNMNRLNAKYQGLDQSCKYYTISRQTAAVKQVQKLNAGRAMPQTSGEKKDVTKFRTKVTILIEGG